MIKIVKPKIDFKEYHFSNKLGKFVLIDYGTEYCGPPDFSTYHIYLVDFKVSEKRRGYGTLMFKEVQKLVKDLYANGEIEFNVLIMPEETEEAVGFWKKILGGDCNRYYSIPYKKFMKL